MKNIMKRTITILLCTMCATIMCLACGLYPIVAQSEAVCYSETRYGSEFQGGNYQGAESRTVDYSYYVKDYYINPYSVSNFVVLGKTNACAVNAGGNICTYYDRTYPTLVPNYQAEYFWGMYYYGSQNDGINTMLNSLYTRMGTDSEGTTVSGFKSGMSSYVSSMGLSVSIEQVTGSYHNTNIDKIKSALRQEKVAVIFMSNYTVTDENFIELGETNSKIPYSKYIGNHVMVVYGYYDLYYYNNSGSLIGRDTFFHVGTGDKVNLEHGLVNICSYTNVMDIYLIDVY